jgi:hypothetical protein
VDSSPLKLGAEEAAALAIAAADWRDPDDLRRLRRAEDCRTASGS